MHIDGNAGPRRESRTPDVKPDRSAWAVITSPALARFADHNPAVEQWRDLRVDPDLGGLAVDRGRPARVTIKCRDGLDEWSLPVTGVLETRLAWHPDRSLVAGLAFQDRRLRPWVADYRARTVRTYEQVRAATSLVVLGHPPLQPLVWHDAERLLLLTPAPDESCQEQVPSAVALGPIVYEATGPAYVTFAPGLDRLAALAGVAVAVLNLDNGAHERVTPRLLVRGLAVSADGPLVEYVDEAATGDRDLEEFQWSAGLVDIAGRSTRPRATSLVTPRPPSPDDLGVLAPAASALGRDEPVLVADVPTGYDKARLTVWPAAKDTGRGPALLWIQSRRPGQLPVAHRPTALAGTGYRGAVLDLPLHWPSDARVGMLRDQIVRTVRTSLDVLSGQGNGSVGGGATGGGATGSGRVVVGGHSFGATLALYALAHVPELAAAIAHSGCYNRTLTPAGFQYERRSYWEVPEVYHAFSAQLFADRLDRPVLIVHGAEDSNPATPPDQAVQLYQGIVATGGCARLVLLPYEGHVFGYEETRQALIDVHGTWLARFEHQPDCVTAGC